MACMHRETGIRGEAVKKKLQKWIQEKMDTLLKVVPADSDEWRHLTVQSKVIRRVTRPGHLLPARGNEIGHPSIQTRIQSFILKTLLYRR